MIDESSTMIAFDLFGVILEEGHLISNGLFKYLPDDIDKKKVKRLYKDYNLNQLNEKRFWHEIGILDYQAIRQTFLNEFKLDPEFESVISQLGKQFKLSILSNLPADWADALSRKYNFASRFDPICFSGHLGYQKPQPEIYLHLVNQSGLNPENIIFVDDRLENLKAAKTLGMQVIYFQRENETYPFQPDVTIQKLSDLLILQKHYL